jgi:hypothetical protein
MLPHLGTLSDVSTMARKAIRSVNVSSVNRLGLRFSIFDVAGMDTRRRDAYGPNHLINCINLIAKIQEPAEDTQELDVVPLEREDRDQILLSGLDEPTH